MSSKTSRPWGCAILSFISGGFAVIVLLIAAYFGIRMFDISGRVLAALEIFCLVFFASCRCVCGKHIIAKKISLHKACKNL